MTGERAVDVLALLGASTARLLEVVATTPPADLERPSRLPGWDRTTVLAHLRHVAAATRRMTDDVLHGRPTAMYPGGRAERPATLRPRAGESTADLVRSHAEEAGRLAATWAPLQPAEWERRTSEPELGDLPLSRLLVLRLTEVEVHGEDLGLGLGPWSDGFVEVVLPLRVAWLPRLHSRPDAVALDATWRLRTDGRTWLVTTRRGAVAVAPSEADAPADCEIAADPVDLLRLLLGRPTSAPPTITGDAEVAAALKRAFPGP